MKPARPGFFHRRTDDGEEEGWWQTKGQEHQCPSAAAEAPEASKARVNGKSENGNGWSKTAITILLTFITSLIALGPVAMGLLNTITDLKLKVQACEQHCEAEKLRADLDHWIVQLENLKGGPGETGAALKDMAAILGDIREAVNAEKKEPKP